MKPQATPQAMPTYKAFIYLSTAQVVRVLIPLLTAWRLLC